MSTRQNSANVPTRNTRLIAVVNQKGGSGKTTTVVNLAATLAEKGRKVLVMDLDPQHNTTDWLNVDNSAKGIYSVFVENGNVSDIIYESDIENVDVVPSSDWLMGIEPQLAGQPGADAILKSKLRTLPIGMWDYIIIDCQPTLGTLTVNALSAVSEVLIPVEAHVLALSGFVQILRTVETIKDRLNKHLRISGILACRVDNRTNHAQEVVSQLRERFKELVYKTTIRENIRLAECPSFHQPITKFAPKSIGAADYRALAKEIMKQEGKNG